MSTLTHDVTLLYCRSGQFLVWFISQCGTAQLRLSLFFLFSCATADIVIDVDGLDNILPSWSSSTLTSMTMIFSTNQRPRKCDMTERRKERHFDIMTTNALRAAAVKTCLFTFMRPPSPVLEFLTLIILNKKIN